MATRTDISNEARFAETTRIKQDLHSIAKGWAAAQPMLEIRLHKDIEF